MQLRELLIALPRLRIERASFRHRVEVALLPLRLEDLVHQGGALVHEPQLLVELGPHLRHLRRRYVLDGLLDRLVRSARAGVPELRGNAPERPALRVELERLGSTLTRGDPLAGHLGGQLLRHPTSLRRARASSRTRMRPSTRRRAPRPRARAPPCRGSHARRRTLRTGRRGRSRRRGSIGNHAQENDAHFVALWAETMSRMRDANEKAGAIAAKDHRLATLRRHRGEHHEGAPTQREAVVTGNRCSSADNEAPARSPCTPPMTGHLGSLPSR